MGQEGVMGVIIIFIIMVVVIVLASCYYIGDHGLKSTPLPEVSTPSTNCDSSIFLKEYGLSGVYAGGLVYNSYSYQILRVSSKDLVLPLIDSTCSLDTDSDSVEDVFTYNHLIPALSDKTVDEYRDLASCYSVSVGARPVCSMTSAINGVATNQVVEAATDNEKETISLVNRLAPRGWKKEVVAGSKGLIRITKVLEGPGPLSLAFDVADTTACTFKDSPGVFIYDYALTFGDRLWYRLKNKNTYQGMDSDLSEVNSGLITIMTRQDLLSAAKTALGGAIAWAFGGKNCGYLVADRFQPELTAVNQVIASNRLLGKADAETYIQWIKPIKGQAAMVRADTLDKTDAQSMFSLTGYATGAFFVTKWLDYWMMKNHYDAAENLYNRGLFISAQAEYAFVSEPAERWHNQTTYDFIFSGGLWTIIVIICLLILTGRRRDSDYWS
jgi:hypothetical protein